MSFCLFLYRISVLLWSAPKLKIEWHTALMREFTQEANVYTHIECLPAFKSDTPRAGVSLSVLVSPYLCMSLLSFLSEPKSLEPLWVEIGHRITE